MAKQVSKAFAEKWYNIGLGYQDEINVKSAIRTAIDHGNEIDCWEACAAFRAGYKKYKFEILTYERFGDVGIGIDGYAIPSKNYMTNEYEDGVSVIDNDWATSIRGQVSIIEYGKTKKVKVSGLHVGYGSDGEIVILPVEVV
jgi:hypothetical protein